MKQERNKIYIFVFKYSILNEDLIKKNKIRGRKQCAVNIVVFYKHPVFVPIPIK